MLYGSETSTYHVTLLLSLFQVTGSEGSLLPCSKDTQAACVEARAGRNWGVWPTNGEKYRLPTTMWVSLEMNLQCLEIMMTAMNDSKMACTLTRDSEPEPTRKSALGFLNHRNCQIIQYFTHFISQFVLNMDKEEGDSLPKRKTNTSVTIQVAWNVQR